MSMKFGTLSTLGMLPLLSGGHAGFKEKDYNSINDLLKSAPPVSRNLDALGLSMSGLGGRPGDGVTSGAPLLLALMNEGSSTTNNTKVLIPRDIDTNSSVIEDFESGYANNWELKGTSFSKGVPFDVETYNKRAASTGSVIGGVKQNSKKIAFTYDRGNTDTGTAVSNPFKVKWDKISFDIMGGSTSATRVDLVIVESDGTERTVRTATGDGTMTFATKSWNVKEFKDKEAKIVITDNDGSARNFAFVGVDNFVGGGLSSTSNTYVNNLIVRSGARGVLENVANYLDGTSMNFEKTLGVSRLEFERMRSLVNARMLKEDLDHAPGWTLKDPATKIKNAVLPILKDANIDIRSLYGQRLLAEAVCGWIRSHLVYNSALDANRGLSRDIRKRFWTSETLISSKDFFAVCAGFSRLTQDLSRECGLECYQVSGVTRNQNNNTTQVDHSWNVFILKDPATSKSYTLWSDNSRGREGLQLARARGDLHQSPHVFPNDPAEFGYFLLQKFQLELEGKPSPRAYKLTDLSFEEWARWGRLDIIQQVDRAVNSQFPNGNAGATVDISNFK